MSNWMLTSTFILFIILSSGSSYSYGLQHNVGDSIWSIPPTSTFYNDWSASKTFHIGDTLCFEFDSGLSNVVQVSRGGYDSCTGDQAFEAFMDGPAFFTLTEEGMVYFICNITSNCGLGQKVSVVVDNQNSGDSNLSTPSPSPLPFSL